MHRRTRSWHRWVLALVATTLFSSIVAQDAATTAAAAARPAAATVSPGSTAAEDPSSSPRISCRVHVVNNTGSPTTFRHVQSSLKIPAAADISDVSVIVQVQHPDVAELEVTLSAAGSSDSSSKVILKSPAVGVKGGANMVQTIFSDWAPVPFPNEASEAPYSSVYRPAQAFRNLVSGNSTAAGAGGSEGVWTLSVTDKASGDLSRRPLKLTGWELWLCGESDGPLFAPAEGDDTATAFDGSDISTTVVKKAVPSSKNVDVNVLVKAGYRAEQVATDPINHVIHTVNEYLAKGMASHFDKASAALAQANPELAAHLSGTMAKVQSRLQGMPGLMGYQPSEDGSWTLPTSAQMIQSFLDTLTHCYYDLYWCWENTGLRGNFALDFASTWDATSGPMAAAWSAMQNEWSKALAGFDAAFPGLNSWSDTLFYSVINLLYNAAAADAVASVGEAYFDTALRLAIYASPIRFAVNPRAAIVQTLSVVADAVNDVFLALEFAPDLVDANNNNDVSAITAIAEALTSATRKTVDLLAEGLNLRADGMQQALANSAGGLARRAADVNDKLTQTVSQISPDLGEMFKAATQPTSDVLRNIAQTRTDAMSQYFKSQNYQQVLGAELTRSADLMGNVTVAVARESAKAFNTAQKALDDVLPGPSLEMVLGNLRGNISGILDDSRKALENLLPIPELQELDQLMRATTDSIIELLDESAKQVQSSDGAKAIQKQLGLLADGLNKAQKGVGEVFNGIVKGFPGPLLNSTIGVIQREANKAINEVNDMFDRLNKDYPNTDPKKFIEQLGKSLDQLLTDTLGQTNAFSAMASLGDSQRLSTALPGLMEPVSKAVLQAQRMAGAVLPKSITGDMNMTKFAELQQGISEQLMSYSDRVSAIARSMPVQPPLANITDNLARRSSDLAQQTPQLQQAVVDAINMPVKVTAAAVSDFNSNLERLLQDLDSQSFRGGELVQLLAEQLQGLPQQIDQTLGGVLSGFRSATNDLEKLLPDLPDIRKQLDALLGPPMRALDAQLQAAGEEAVKAAKAASQGLVNGLAGALQGINKMLVDGQWQLAGLLGSVVQATKQLDTAASALDKTLAPQLASLDKNMADLAKSVSSDLEKRLEEMRPPVAVLENLIRPLAASLNDQLGNITQLMSLNGPNVQKGVNDVLQQLQGVAGNLVNGASGALGLPPLPPLPPLPGMDKTKPETKPSKSDNNSKDKTDNKDDKGKKDDSKDSKGKKDDSKDSKGKSDSSKDGSSKDKGRNLLQFADDTALPLLEVAFSIPDLADVVGGNGTNFDPAAFRQAVVSGVNDAVNSFANDFVGSVLGLRGVSQMDGVNSVLQSLGNTVNDAVMQLQNSLTVLPKGPVFEFLTTGNREALQPLQQLQQTLVTAFDGPAANGTAVDAQQLASLFNRAGSTLQALGGAVQRGRTANSGDVVKQLAQQFTTVSDAAVQMLEGMKNNLHSMASQAA